MVSLSLYISSSIQWTARRNPHAMSARPEARDPQARKSPQGVGAWALGGCKKPHATKRPPHAPRRPTRAARRRSRAESSARPPAPEPGVHGLRSTGGSRRSGPVERTHCLGPPSRDEAGFASLDFEGVFKVLRSSATVFRGGLCLEGCGGYQQLVLQGSRISFWLGLEKLELLLLFGNLFTALFIASAALKLACQVRVLEPCFLPRRRSSRGRRTSLPGIRHGCRMSLPAPWIPLTARRYWSRVCDIGIALM